MMKSNLYFLFYINREDLDDDEYDEMKQDSIQQLEEMKELLQKTKQKGEMSLVDDVNRMQLVRFLYIYLIFIKFVLNF